jgi:hypothetical protein
VIVTALVLLAMPASLPASDWSWTTTLYGWASDVTVDATVNDRQVISGEVDFTDLIDDADFAAMIHLEGKRDKVGLFADLIVTDFGDEPRLRSLGPLTVQAESDLEMTILEARGVYNPGAGGRRPGDRHPGGRAVLAGPAAGRRLDHPRRRPGGPALPLAVRQPLWDKRRSSKAGSRLAARWNSPRVVTTFIPDASSRHTASKSQARGMYRIQSAPRAAISSMSRVATTPVLPSPHSSPASRPVFAGEWT